MLGKIGTLVSISVYHISEYFRKMISTFLVARLPVNDKLAAFLRW
jgi:hypothetical protein